MLPFQPAAQEIWQQKLRALATSSQFSNAISESFGIQGSSPHLESLRDLLLDADSTDHLQIAELGSENLQNHLGAYSKDTNTIYLDCKLDPATPLAELVLAHELGHWIDRQLNGSNTSHKAVKMFAHEILGLTNEPSLINAAPPPNSAGTGQITLANGEKVSAEFFDTTLHNNWRFTNLPFLSIAANSVIENAQKDTDAFNSFGSQGLQTNSASHFDKNHLVGGQEAILLRYQDALKQFNTDTTIPLVEADPFTGGSNRADAIPNPEIKPGDKAFRSTPPPTGVLLLLYRFGQICHTIEDFYSHSNWVELSNKNIIAKDSLFLNGLGLPTVVREGEFIPGTQVLITGRGSWSDLLQTAGRDTFEVSTNDFRTRDVYFTVDSDVDPEDGGGVVSATTLDGRTVYGLVSGGTAESIWKDSDYNPFLRDPRKTAWYQKKYFEGYGHGGAFVGYGPGQRLGPLNKDSSSNKNFGTAKRLANLQVRHEWDRLGNLIYQAYGQDGLKRFAEAALAPEFRDQYISTYSVPGGEWDYPSMTFNADLASTASEDISILGNKSATISNIKAGNQSAALPGYEGVVSGMNNWLASVDSNRYITDIGIVATHNSMAYKRANGGPDTVFVGLLNQRGYDLLSQFNGGVRVFSLLTETRSVGNDSTFNFTHNGKEVGGNSDEAFKQLFTALANNPSEFISFSIKPYGGDAGAVRFNYQNGKVREVVRIDENQELASKYIEHALPVNSLYYPFGKFILPTNGSQDPNEQSIFWSSAPGRRIHSFFFQDGYALQGTPRVWDDSVFNQWGIDIPEEKKALLRGKPLFYIPSAGQNHPAIPKLDELRGKFALADESWISFPYLDKLGILQMADGYDGFSPSNVDKKTPDLLTPEYLEKYYPQYAPDFPAGIKYDRTNYRRDEGQDEGHGHYYIRNSRWDVANFIDHADNQPKPEIYSPIWLGAAEGNGRNLLENTTTGVLTSHDYWWNIGGYNGDNGSPSIADDILTGGADGGRIKKPAVGTVNGTFFTDFGAKPYYGESSFTAYGKSPASIVAEAQPRVEVLVGGSGVRWPGSNVFDIEIATNIPGKNWSDYGLVVTNLSGSKTRPKLLQGGAEGGYTGSSIEIYPTGSRSFSVAVPKDDPASTTYFSVQAKELASGKLFGAPKIIDSPPIVNPSLPPLRNISLFSLPASPVSASPKEVIPDGVKSDPEVSIRNAIQFMDASGQWLDTEFTDLSEHYEPSDADLILLKTPSENQHSERGERAIWIEDDTAYNDYRSNIFMVDNFNTEVPVSIANFDLSYDEVVLVSEDGTEQSLSPQLYQPQSIKKLARRLAEDNIYLDYTPLPEYAPKTLIVSSDQLSSALAIEASSFAEEAQGSPLSFSDYDGLIPFLTLQDGKLVSGSIDPTYEGKTYTGHVSITNGLSTATDVEIKIAFDPNILINGDSYSTQNIFSIDPIGDQKSFTIYASIGEALTETQFIPIASSIGLASGAPAGLEESKLQYNFSSIDDYGDVNLWIQTSTGNSLQPLGITTMSTGLYKLDLDGKPIAEMRSLDYRRLLPEIGVISCNDSLFDGLGISLGQTGGNLKAKAGDDFWNATLEIDLYREAAFSNTVGLYLFDKQCGSIIDPVSGQRVLHNSSDWVNDVERLAVWTGTVGNMATSNQTARFKMNGAIDPNTVALLPYIKVSDGSSTVYYSSFDSLNPDSASHIKVLSNTAFGFEDMGADQSDHDFDDVAMNILNLTLV